MQKKIKQSNIHVIEVPERGEKTEKKSPKSCKYDENYRFTNERSSTNPKQKKDKENYTMSYYNQIAENQ